MSQVCRQLKSKESLDLLDDNFDIVESEPDSCGDEEDGGDASSLAVNNHCIPPAGPSRRKLSQSAQALLNAAEAESLGAMAADCQSGGTIDVQKLSEAALAKERQILQTEVGFWDVMSCIGQCSNSELFAFLVILGGICVIKFMYDVPMIHFLN